MGLVARLLLRSVRKSLSQTLGCMVGAALLAVAASLAFASALRGSGIPLADASFADYLANLTAGLRNLDVDPMSMSIDRAVSAPAAWMLLVSLMAFSTLRFPFEGLRGEGGLVLVLSGSRVAWWVATCVWTILVVLAMWGSCLLSLLAWVLSTSGRLSWEISSFTPFLLQFDVGSLCPTPWPMAAFLGSAILVSCAVCLVQLLLATLLHPLVAYGLTLGYLFLSIFLQRSWLLGNYLMAARSGQFLEGGVSAGTGALFALSLCLVSIVGGGLVFRHLDVLGRRLSQ